MIVQLRFRLLFC